MTIADVQLEEDLYFRLVAWHRISPDESYARILERPVFRLQKFGRSHYYRTLHALRKAGVPVEEIVRSPFWTTAPGEWRSYSIRKLRKEDLWPAEQPDDSAAARGPRLNIDELLHSHGRQILKRRITELGELDMPDFASLMLALWRRGVPFEKGGALYYADLTPIETEVRCIVRSPLWASAPNQWRARFLSLLRKTRREERIKPE